MDNIFEIVVGLVIIYSLLGPLFKKKKGKELPSPSKPDYEEMPEAELPQTTSAKKKDYDDFDILREVEELFKEHLPQEIPAPKPKPRIEVKPKIEPKRDVPVDVWREHKRNESELKYQEKVKPKTVFKQKVEPIKNKRVQHSDFSIGETSVEDLSNLRAKEILVSIRDPRKLSDYILVSEILGKPKALRR
jgi:hypothetical protein